MGARRPFFVDGGLSELAKGSHEKERQLQREVTRMVEGAIPGIEVLALELNGGERFCVFVDHPRGVDHALCERVTQVLQPYLDTYGVEVSSPGFDRPLRTKAHFERALGHAVSVKTGSRRARGEVISTTEQGVQIRNGSEPVDIPYEEIVRANLIDTSFNDRK
jgi:ribosome maturation factor RimP